MPLLRLALIAFAVACALLPRLSYAQSPVKRQLTCSQARSLRPQFLTAQTVGLSSRYPDVLHNRSTLAHPLKDDSYLVIFDEALDLDRGEFRVALHHSGTGQELGQPGGREIELYRYHRREVCTGDPRTPRYRCQWGPLAPDYQGHRVVSGGNNHFVFTTYEENGARIRKAHEENAAPGVRKILALEAGPNGLPIPGQKPTLVDFFSEYENGPGDQFGMRGLSVNGGVVSWYAETRPGDWEVRYCFLGGSSRPGNCYHSVPTQRYLSYSPHLKQPLPALPTSVTSAPFGWASIYAGNSGNIRAHHFDPSNLAAPSGDQEVLLPPPHPATETTSYRPFALRGPYAALIYLDDPENPASPYELHFRMLHPNSQGRPIAATYQGSQNAFGFPLTPARNESRVEDYRWGEFQAGGHELYLSWSQARVSESGISHEIAVHDFDPYLRYGYYRVRPWLQYNTQSWDHLAKIEPFSHPVLFPGATNFPSIPGRSASAQTWIVFESEQLIGNGTQHVRHSDIQFAQCWRKDSL